MALGQARLDDAALAMMLRWLRSAPGTAARLSRHHYKQPKRSIGGKYGLRLAHSLRNHQDTILMFATALAVGLTFGQAERDVCPGCTKTPPSSSPPTRHRPPADRHRPRPRHPTVIITNDHNMTTRNLIRQYARRMTTATPDTIQRRFLETPRTDHHHQRPDHHPPRTPRLLARAAQGRAARRHHRSLGGQPDPALPAHMNIAPEPVAWKSALTHLLTDGLWLPAAIRPG
jgi:hypothetical protein